jgi:hypothetical protein
VALEQIDQLGVRGWLAEALIRHDVRGDIEDGLNGDLQRMLGEALLELVDGEIGGSRQRAQLVHGGFDERELLGDEIGIGHRAAARPFR